MSDSVEILPTNTCPPDLAELSRRSESFARFAPQVHLDIDDAKFAPVLSWPYQDGQWSELDNQLPFADAIRYETHLMVEDPLEIGERLARAGCTRVIAHAEVFEGDEAGSAFAAWRAAGAAEVGLALLIETPLSRLDGIAEQCDAVLLMSIVTLGSQGAQFDPRVFGRIEELRARYPLLPVAVDGGVSEANIADLVKAGARRFGVGSAIGKAQDPAAAYRNLLSLAEAAIE